MNATSNVATALAHLADEYACTITWIARQSDILAGVHIDPAAITDEVIAEAAHYFNALNDRSVRQAMKKWNQGAGEEVQIETKSDGAKAPRKMGKVLRAKVLGYSATAILRWMGAHDWTFEDAGVVMATAGAARISDVTIRLQLKAGKTGQRGPAAPVTPAQAARLKQMTK